MDIKKQAMMRKMNMAIITKKRKAKRVNLNDPNIMNYYKITNLICEIVFFETNLMVYDVDSIA